MVLICFCSLTSLCHGQNKGFDSLMHVLTGAKSDTAKVNTLNELAGLTRNNNPDTSIYFALQANGLATSLNYKLGIAVARATMSSANINLGKFDEALNNSNNALELCDQLLQMPAGMEKSRNRFRILQLKSLALKNKGVVFGNRGRYTEALEHTRLALKINEEIGDKQGIARCNGNLGLIYDYQGNHPEALKNYFEALKINKEIGDKQGIALNYGNLGNILGSQGNFPEALNNFLSALKISEETGDKHGIARNDGNIGLIYFSLGNLPEALKYYLAALKMYQEVGDKMGIALIYGNIGNVYGSRGNYSEAVKYQTAAIKMNEEIGNKKDIALNYGNIGNIYTSRGNYPEALKNQFAALKICDEIGDKAGIALSCYNIGVVFAKQKNYKQSIQYLNKSLALANENGSLNAITEVYGELAMVDSARGDFKKALEHYKLHIAARDSMFNRENTQKIVQSKMQYEFDQKEAQAKAEQEKKDALALKELQRQKLLANFFIGMIGLVLVLSFFIYRSYRARQLLRLNDIRNKIAGDLHDDIGSTLNSISVYSEVARKNDANHDEALEMIGDASRKVIDAMSDIVWTINAENDSFAKIIFRMKSLAFNLFRAKQIEFTFHADEILSEKKLSLEERRNFYLIFKEAINNLVKYSNATHAEIRLTNENNLIRLHILDDGAGFDTSQENQGNGLKNMRRRADEMKAELKIESQPGKGTQIELTLKA